MRMPNWLRVAAVLLLPACAMGVDDPANETRDLNTELGLELGLEGLEPDECPGKPGFPTETELRVPEVLPQRTDRPVVVVRPQVPEPNLIGEEGAPLGNMAGEVDAQYLEAYPRFDDCVMPGHYCW